MRTQVRSLALLSGLRIWHCCELWYRSQTQLRSGVAVAGSYSSDWTPSLGISICHGCSSKKTKDKKKYLKKLNFKNVKKNIYVYYVNFSLIHDIEISIHGNLKVALTGSSVHSPEFQETICQSGERRSWCRYDQVSGAAKGLFGDLKTSISFWLLGLLREEHTRPSQ